MVPLNRATVSTFNSCTEAEGFLYAPFGEITTEYASMWQNGTLPKYSFNAKELDEETGMYYYRYYKPPVFTSRDPMMDQKPWLTPYHYCSNNPVGRMDPSGCEDWIPPTDGSGNWTAERGDGYWKLAQQAGISLEEARTAVVTAYHKRGQKRKSEIMVYPGDVVHIENSHLEADAPSIPKYPGLTPASGRIEPVFVVEELLIFGTGKTVTKVAFNIAKKIPLKIVAENKSEFKKLVTKLSQQQDKPLSQRRFNKFRKLAQDYNGKIRIDKYGEKGTGTQPHAHVEGMGQKIESRHVWIKEKVE